MAENESPTVESAVEAWNIEVARLTKVRVLVEAMERDYSHAEAGHVRMAARRLLAALDTPVEELRASLRNLAAPVPHPAATDPSDGGGGRG